MTTIRCVTCGKRSTAVSDSAVPAMVATFRRHACKWLEPAARTAELRHALEAA